MAALRIRDFTDPACPFAFSAEPARMKLRWLYGDQIEWEPRMVVLSESPRDYEAKGFTPELQSAALEMIGQRYGMPIDTRRRPRMMATVHACRAVVAARLRAPDREQALLRRLRIRAMAGDLIDEPGGTAPAAREAGIEPMSLFRAEEDDPSLEVALREDMAAARAPSAAAQALPHKLGPGPRYTCPSYEIARAGGGGWPRFDVPGLPPVEVSEAAIATLAPDRERRPRAESGVEVREWAGEPLAAAEVAAIRGVTIAGAEAELAAAGAQQGGWWSLPGEGAPEKIAA